MDKKNKTLISFLEKNIFPYLKKINKIKFLDSLREAVIMALPIIFLFFLFFLFYKSGNEESIKEKALHSFSAALGVLGVWVSFYLPFAHMKKQNIFYALILGIFSFFSFMSLFLLESVSYHGFINFLIRLSQGGVIFSFIIGGIFIYVMDRVCKENKLLLFFDLFLLFISFLILSACMKKFGFNLMNWINIIIKPLLVGADTLPAVVILVFLMSLFWLSGIHGTGVIGGAVLPFYLMLFNANVAAYSNGQALPYVVTPPFFMWCMIGGTGATLPLSFYMLFSSSKHLRKIGKISILPSLVNINEPLVFGTPLILNPIIAIPFVLTPVVLAVVNYIALYFNLVNRIFILPVFAIPTPFYAYLSNLDYRVIILIIIDIIISFVIYYPFYKTLEKYHLEKENQVK